MSLKEFTVRLDGDGLEGSRDAELTFSWKQGAEDIIAINISLYSSEEGPGRKESRWGYLRVPRSEIVRLGQLFDGVGS